MELVPLLPTARTTTKAFEYSLTSYGPVPTIISKLLKSHHQTASESNWKIILQATFSPSHRKYLRIIPKNNSSLPINEKTATMRYFTKNQIAFRLPLDMDSSSLDYLMIKSKIEESHPIDDVVLLWQVAQQFHLVLQTQCPANLIERRELRWDPTDGQPEGQPEWLIVNRQSMTSLVLL